MKFHALDLVQQAEINHRVESELWNYDWLFSYFVETEAGSLTEFDNLEAACAYFNEQQVKNNAKAYLILTFRQTDLSASCNIKNIIDSAEEVEDAKNDLWHRVSEERREQFAAEINN